MKISKNLPQFNHAVALLAVVSKRKAQCYIATEGYVTSVRTVNVRPPQYTDREGFFETRGKGEVYSSRAVYEKKKQKMEHELLPKLTKAIESAFDEYRVTDMYLFAPAYLIRDIRNTLSGTLTGTLRLEIEGNYYSHHPFQILRKIKEETERLWARPERPEAIKILKRRRLHPEGV